MHGPVVVPVVMVELLMRLTHFGRLSRSHVKFITCSKSGTSSVLALRTLLIKNITILRNVFTYLRVEEEEEDGSDGRLRITSCPCGAVGGISGKSGSYLVILGVKLGKNWPSQGSNGVFF